MTEIIRRAIWRYRIRRAAARLEAQCLAYGRELLRSRTREQQDVVAVARALGVTC